MKKLVIISLAAAAFGAVPVAAKEKPHVFVEAKAVKDAKVVKLDPAKAYVYIRTQAVMPLHFTKIPSAEDQIAYDKLKAAAFAEAREDYEKALKRYQRDLATAEKTKGMKKPTKPPEPTEGNFQFQQFGQLANFTVGAFNRFHNKDGSVYMHEVTPGTYRIFGQVDPLLGMGVCYCMGSVTFQAEAGKIVDLGSITFDPQNYKRAEKGDSSSPIAAAYAFTLTPAMPDTPVDPRVASFPRMAADFRAAGKVANYMGIAVSRLPTIPGVLDYDRDRIVDLKASTAATSPAP
jgi:hypothetical protein